MCINGGACALPVTLMLRLLGNFCMNGVRTHKMFIMKANRFTPFSDLIHPVFLP